MKITFFPKNLDFFNPYVGCYGTVELYDYFRQCTDIEGNNVLLLAGPLCQRQPVHSMFRHFDVSARLIFRHGPRFDTDVLLAWSMFQRG